MKSTKPSGKTGQQPAGATGSESTSAAPKPDNMKRIVDAATNLFAAQGYAATSVEQVAAVCGAGKDTIYRRFPSKLALFGAVLSSAREKRITQLQDIADRQPKDGHILERLRKIARWFLDANLDPELMALKRIAFIEPLVFSNQSMPGSHHDPFVMLLAEHLAEGQRAGVIQGGDRFFLANQLIHCIVAEPLGHALVGGRDYDAKAARDKHFKAAWDLFLRGAGR